MTPTQLATTAVVAVIGVGSTAPLIPVRLDCPVSYEISLYDTPDGTLADGFYETLASGQFSYFAPSATSTNPNDRQLTVSKSIPVGRTEAKVVGTAAKTICTDLAGVKVIKDLPIADYQSLAAPGAGQPVETQLTSAVDLTTQSL